MYMEMGRPQYTMDWAHYGIESVNYRERSKAIWEHR